MWKKKDCLLNLRVSNHQQTRFLVAVILVLSQTHPHAIFGKMPSFRSKPGLNSVFFPSSIPITFLHSWPIFFKIFIPLFFFNISFFFRLSFLLNPFPSFFLIVFPSGSHFFLFTLYLAHISTQKSSYQSSMRNTFVCCLWCGWPPSCTPSVSSYMPMWYLRFIIQYYRERERILL